MKMIRRRFLGFGAGAIGGTVLGGFSGRFLGGLAGEIDRPLRPPRGPEDYRLSVCRLCPGGCGIRARCIGDRPVKIKGNPLHPVSGGRLCPKGEASLQALLHPDRIHQPLKRTGPRGVLASFQPVEWDEALSEIAVRLSLLRRQGRPEALCLLRDTGRGVGARIGSRFLEAFGSPNDVVLQHGDDGAAQALRLTQGVSAVPVYDVQRAEQVLSFGSAMLEASSSPVHAMRAFGEFRQGSMGRSRRMVHAGPRLSVTASKADEWVPTRPGTEGVLALGVAGVLVAEELYDRDFVARQAHQFDDFEDSEGRTVQGLRTLLRRDFPLERVSLETGVPVNRILRIAREFAGARPGLAIGPRGGPLLSGQLFDHLAVHVLNGLVGNIDAPGGVLVPERVPLRPWPELAPDPVAEAGRERPRLDGSGDGNWLIESDPETFAEAVVAQAPYRAGALILLDADPAFASLAPDSFPGVLEQIPLVVSLASIPNDTSLDADWILPTTHPLEAWDLDVTPPGVPFPIATLARPVSDVARQGSRSAGNIFLDLARRLGGPIQQALPWKDDEALVQEEVRGLFEAQRGAVLRTEFDEAWIRLMERAGWWAPGYRSEQELWTRVQETGGWWDPFYDHWHWKRVLETDSGRFEFRPAELSALSEQRRSRWTSAAAGSEELMATPMLSLQLFEPLPVSGGVGAELPFLQEILDPGYDAGWESWVELNPQTAARLSVKDLDQVRVSSTQGSIRVRARVTDRVVPGVAAVPVGLGKRAGGRWAAGRGANPLRLLTPVRELVGGLVDLSATHVRVAVVHAGPEQEEGRRGDRS